MAEIVRVPLGQITPDPANVRLHPPENLEDIRGSLQRFRQQKPIVVDAKGIIRAGNGTYQAAKLLGWTEIDVVYTDLQGSEAIAYSIADNRASELAQWDHEALQMTLQGLEEEDPDLLVATGFSQEELQAYMAEALPDAPDEFPNYDETIETEYCCPQCGYEWSGKPK